MRRWLLALPAWTVAAFAASPCHAAGPLGPNGQPITTSGYSIDLFQGAIFSGTRITGMGGAYVAIAEDVDGDLQNPASPANRPFFSVSYFDWWLGLGATFPGTLQNMDFFNSGSETELYNSPDSLVFVTPAMNLQWGPWGIGITLELSTYSIGAEEDSTGLEALFAINHLQVARTLFEGQLAVGLGSRVLAMDLEESDSEESIFTSVSSGAEIGALLRPTDLPFRIGAAYRSAVRTEARYSDDLLPNESGDVIIKDNSGRDVYIPTQSSLPWDLNVGAALQIGRPFNLGWRRHNKKERRTELQFELSRIALEEDRDERLSHAATEREREAIEEEFDSLMKNLKRERHRIRQEVHWEQQEELAALKRFYFLLSGSMVISGSSSESVGVESFLSQRVQRSGRSTVYSPRFGAETEVLPDILKLRGGSYLEPARLDGASSRWHATAGLDFRLIRWGVFGIGPDDYLWRLALSADVAERYFTWGIMVGGWYPRHTDPDRKLWGKSSTIPHFD